MFRKKGIMMGPFQDRNVSEYTFESESDMGTGSDGLGSNSEAFGIGALAEHLELVLAVR
jgi:hypothetical protein